MRIVGIGLFSLILLVCSNALGGAELTIDPSRYITVDEVRTEMDCYCLTVLEGTKAEKFPLKILSVVRNHMPGRDMILVIGLDERFIHAGPVHGCSGSPVFIDGRMAGALAAGWDGTIDPLYLVTPIHDMLAVGTADQPTSPGVHMGMVDMTKPLDLRTVYNDYIESLRRSNTLSSNKLELSTSFGAGICDELNELLGGAGFSFLPMTGTSTGGTVDYGQGFEPGGVLVGGLCVGDINLTAAGTVTDVVGDQVFGFGHAFLGEGATNIPMANGFIHTVVAGRQSSFKLSSPGPILGTLEFDQSTAVRGTIGVEPKTIDIVINVKRFDDAEDRRYQCKMAVNKRLTPMLMQVVVGAAGMMRGALPTHHQIDYSIEVAVKDAPAIVYKNVSSDQQLRDIGMEATGIAAMLMNNPFKEAQLERVEVNLDIQPGTLLADIWSIDVANTKLKAGDTLTVELILQSKKNKREQHTLTLPIPKDLPVGKYAVQISGLKGYEGFLQKTAPQRYNAFNFESLMKGLQWLTQFRQDRLYLVMTVPGGGIAMRERELPNLPGTKMLLMQDAKRIYPATPVKHWVESSVETGLLFEGSYTIAIEIEDSY